MAKAPHDDPFDRRSADLGSTLERDTAVTGSPEPSGDDPANDGRSSPQPAEGDNDTPPPGEGSPEG